MSTDNVEPSQEYTDLLFCIRRSVRYHRRRYGFFRHCNDLGLFLVFLLSTATITIFLKEVFGDAPLWLKILPSIVISVIVGINLIFRLGKKHITIKRF